MANDYVLVIGSKNYSSWSLRPWLAMKRGGIAFREIVIDLKGPGRLADLARHSPSGKVPVLRIGDLVVWDSLAIVETMADRHPEANLWPADKDARARARSLAAEMHAGFFDLRQSCPMNMLAREPRATLPDAVAENVRRIVTIWKEARGRFGKGGPFLFGAFSNADAMYAPVASRFRTYVPDLKAYGDDGTAAAYVEAIFAMSEMAEWIEGARREEAARR